MISTKGYVGGIVGNARSVSVNLSNCAFYGSVKAGAQYAAGLIVGQTGDYTITNCTVAGKVEGTSDVLAVATYTTEMTEENERTISNTYVLLGTGNGLTKNTAAGADIKVLNSIGGLFGNNIDIAGWNDRLGDLIVPNVCYVPDMIYTQAMVSGAAVRLDNPTGIRFTAVLGGAYFNSIKGDKEATFGIIIAPTDYVDEAGEFTVDALDALEYEYSYVIIPAELIYGGSEDMGYYEFRGTLGNIHDYNYEREFSAIAYVEVDGVYYYSAYNAEDNSRSIAYVAQMAYEDTNFEETDTYKYEVVDGQGEAGVWSPYTVEQREILLSFFGKSDAVNISFLSYNVRNAEIEEDDYGFMQIDKPTYEYTDREKYVVEYLLGYGADIIGLQEVAYVDGTFSDLNMFDVLGNDTKSAGLTAAGYTCVTGDELYGGTHSYKKMWNPIYYKTDMFDLIAQDTVWFTDEESRYSASKIESENTPYKGLNYVVLEHKESGEQFVYVNVHLIVISRTRENYFLKDNNGNILYEDDGVTPRQIQEKQIIYLREILQSIQDEYDLPMFIGGDFNRSFNNVNTQFKNRVYDENGVISNGTPEETVKLSITRDTASSKQTANSCPSGGNFTTRLTLSGSPIDLWFTSNFDNGFVGCYQIIDNWNESIQKYPSDHCPAKLYVTLYMD